MNASNLERSFCYWLKIRGLPMPVAEYVFAPPRRWRFDFAYLNEKIGVELEGGIFIQGAHTRGEHFESDCEKYNTAVLLGWRVLRFTEKDLRHGEAMIVIEKILGIQPDPLAAEKARREAFKVF